MCQGRQTLGQMPYPTALCLPQIIVPMSLQLQCMRWTVNTHRVGVAPVQNCEIISVTTHNFAR